MYLVYKATTKTHRLVQIYIPVTLNVTVETDHVLD
jgi:hypothetical protein